MEIVKDDAGTTSTTTNDPSVTATNDAPAAPAASPSEPQDRRSVIAAALEGYKSEGEQKPTASAVPEAPHAAPAPQPGPLVDPATGRAMEPMKAPNSWTPALREKWGGVDPTVQKFILDRERHMAVTLQETADARKFHKDFSEAFAPMQELMTQNKWQGTPLQVLKSNLELAVALNTGTPQQKAVIFVNLLRHFRPDGDTIRSLLAGEQVNVPPMQRPQVPAPESAQPTRDELLEEARSQEALEQFAADPANEFFADVRVMMGQIISVGLVDENKPMVEQLKDAYALATERHPEIKQVLASRAPVTPVASTSPAAQPRDETGRFAVASPPPPPVRSVKPSLGSGRPSTAPKAYKNRREAALEAFEELQATQR